MSSLFVPLSALVGIEKDALFLRGWGKRQQNNKTTKQQKHFFLTPFFRI
jgi:hypothetical protein